MDSINTGQIVEIYIPAIMSYVYVKYIDVREFYIHVNYPFQFRVSEHFYIKPIDTIENLTFRDLLFSPLHLTGFKELLSNKRWKVIATQKVDENDLSQHHYKMAWPPNLLATFESVKQWRVLKNINDVNNGIIVPYDQCAHLEYAENLGAGYLELRIIVEYYKLKGIQPTFDKANWTKFEYALFSRYEHMPVYKHVPKEFRGKLFPEQPPKISS